MASSFNAQRAVGSAAVATGSIVDTNLAPTGSVTITVAASYTDGHGTVEAVASGASPVVAGVNSAASGSVVIEGTTTQGQTLTASNTLADADGLGAISYQWTAGGANISGATASAWVLTEA